LPPTKTTLSVKSPIEVYNTINIEKIENINVVIFISLLLSFFKLELKMIYVEKIKTSETTFADKPSQKFSI